MLRITATELPRFMACNGSQLMGGFTPPDQPDSLRDEGDAAHWVVEQDFKSLATAASLVDKQAPNGVFITAGMVENCEAYLLGIKSLGGWVENDTSHAGNGWEIPGRSDHIALNGTILYVDDFKYGWKIVEPEGNWTLVSHAIGWWAKNQDAVITEIVFRIYQPRPFHPEGNVRDWRITVQELTVLWRELITKMENPDDILHTNAEAQCYKCPSITQCPANQIATMNSIDVAEKAFDSYVNNDTLSFMLDQTKRAMKTLEQSQLAYEELAEHRIRIGQIVPEYSLSTSLSNKQWKKGVTPDIMKPLTGIDVSKKELITPGQATKLGVPEYVVDILSERNSKGLKLVRVDEMKKVQKALGKKS